MTIIKSHILQFFCLTMSIFMFGMIIFSYVYEESEKYKSIISAIVVSLVLLLASTLTIKYNKQCIIIKLFLFEKIINIMDIKEINYGGVPEVCRIITDYEIFYMPVLLTRKKVKKLFEQIKNINPNVRIFFKI